jgi:hypothetical protein
MPVVGERPDQMDRIAVDHQQKEIADVALPFGPPVRFFRVRLQLRHSAGRAELKRHVRVEAFRLPAYIEALVLDRPVSAS